MCCKRLGARTALTVIYWSLREPLHRLVAELRPLHPFCRWQVSPSLSVRVCPARALTSTIIIITVMADRAATISASITRPIRRRIYWSRPTKRTLGIVYKIYFHTTSIYIYIWETMSVSTEQTHRECLILIFRIKKKTNQLTRTLENVCVGFKLKKKEGQRKFLFFIDWNQKKELDLRAYILIEKTFFLLHYSNMLFFRGILLLWRKKCEYWNLPPIPAAGEFVRHFFFREMSICNQAFMRMI